MEELVKFISESSKNHISEEDTLKCITILNNPSKKAYKLKPGLLDTVNITLENIRYFESQIQKIDRVIEREFLSFPEKQVLTSVRGLGPVLTAGIIAEIGEMSKFESDKKLASYAGLEEAPEWKLGRGNTPLTKSGNEYLGHYLAESVNCLRMYNAEYSGYYHRKYHEARKHQHKKTLALLLES